MRLDGNVCMAMHSLDQLAFHPIYVPWLWCGFIREYSCDVAFQFQSGDLVASHVSLLFRCVLLYSFFDDGGLWRPRACQDL